MTIKVTDEMVNRCRAWFVEQFGTNHNIDKTREMLDRTLNPKPAEEIPVSAPMLYAAHKEATRGWCTLQVGTFTAAQVVELYPRIYRAMEVARRKEESEAALRRGDRRSGKDRRTHHNPYCAARYCRRLTGFDRRKSP